MRPPSTLYSSVVQGETLRKHKSFIRLAETLSQLGSKQEGVEKIWTNNHETMCQNEISLLTPQLIG